MANIPTLQVTEFGGLRNKQAPQEFGLSGFTTADNLNIDAAGKNLFARRGQTLLTATAYRGAYASPDKIRCYAVTDGGVLEDWTGGAGVALRSGFAGYPYWTQIENIVFVGNENQTWRISAIGEVSDNALPVPDVPRLTAVAGGLPAGQYRFVVASVVARRESAPSISAIIEVDGSQDILVTGINGQRLYVAPANSKGFFYWCDTTTTALVYAGGTDALGEELQILDIDPMPDGRCLTSYQGQLHVAIFDARLNVTRIYGSVGRWSDLCDTAADFRQVPGEVRAMQGLKDGLVIGTDRAIWVVKDDILDKLADYGVPPGQPFTVDDDGTCWMATRRGFCSALPFKEVTPHFDMPDPDWTGSAIIRQDGDERFIATISPFATADNTKPAAANANIEIITTEANEFITE